MTNHNVLSKIIIDSEKYTHSITGSFFVLKDQKYPPWEPYANSPEGRYNGPRTGSLYLGDTLETCVLEVGREGKAAYQVQVETMKPQKILDLSQWSIDNSVDSGSLLIPSGSNGWEPTHEIGDWAYGEGYDGIRFISRHGNSRINLVLYRDRLIVQPDNFTQVELPDEDDQ